MVIQSEIARFAADKVVSFFSVQGVLRTSRWIFGR